MRQLSKRGLSGGWLVISEAQWGLKKSAAKVLRATWQRRQVHFMRRRVGLHAERSTKTLRITAAKAVSRRGCCWLTRDGRPDASTVPQTRRVHGRSGNRCACVHRIPERPFETTREYNPLERGNKEIKRRANATGIFSNDTAIPRLVGALVVEQTQERYLTRRYMSNESLATILNSQQAKKLLETSEVARTLHTGDGELHHFRGHYSCGSNYLQLNSY